MRLTDYIHDDHRDPEIYTAQFINNAPYPHIVLDNFLAEHVVKGVVDEYPDLSGFSDGVSFKDDHSIKLGSHGFGHLSGTGLALVSFLQSDVFLEWLSLLTGISEPLISDPYLEGGGYHEISPGGYLKVHVDFARHKKTNLDRRLNLLIYLNPGWDARWGGELGLFDPNDLKSPVKTVSRILNRCVIFSTTSYTYHGHPSPLSCPQDRRRRSLALYYYSNGRGQMAKLQQKRPWSHMKRFGRIMTESLSTRGD